MEDSSPECIKNEISPQDWLNLLLGDLGTSVTAVHVALLHAHFPVKLVDEALELVGHQRVYEIKYELAPGFYEVFNAFHFPVFVLFIEAKNLYFQLSGDTIYHCRIDHPVYCSCETMFDSVCSNSSFAECHHILAIRLEKALLKERLPCKNYRLSPIDFSRLLMRGL
ncbi:hypothetical protein DSO57_1001378 [Entomophthora muscae]|uniref:Uncharacterized protein n=1 Tax=Entomophthora muscae TaxID=34485 RepID=A0ACC2SY06_9FUNG|nr:hypothetical protein DSO57_1001378 [Entomophthora muscae]